MKTAIVITPQFSDQHIILLSDNRIALHKPFVHLGYAVIGNPPDGLTHTLEDCVDQGPGSFAAKALNRAKKEKCIPGARWKILITGFNPFGVAGLWELDHNLELLKIECSGGVLKSYSEEKRDFFIQQFQRDYSRYPGKNIKAIAEEAFTFSGYAGTDTRHAGRVLTHSICITNRL